MRKGVQFENSWNTCGIVQIKSKDFCPPWSIEIIRGNACSVKYKDDDDEFVLVNMGVQTKQTQSYFQELVEEHKKKKCA